MKKGSGYCSVVECLETNKINRKVLGSIPSPGKLFKIISGGSGMIRTLDLGMTRQMGLPLCYNYKLQLWGGLYRPDAGVKTSPRMLRPEIVSASEEVMKR